MAQTVLENISNIERHFGFIPPHGQNLDSGEVLVLDGDLRTILASGRGRFTRQAEITGLDEAVAEGLLSIEEVNESSSST